MRKFFSNWTNWLPFLVYGSLTLFVFLANYQPGTYLLGWDVTMPELNISESFWRSFTGVWQEYRGLGTVDGQSYTANITHWLLVAVLNSFLPQSLIRYIVTFLGWFAGMMGMYYFSRFLLKNRSDSRSSQVVLPILAGLLYGLNFGTTQMFFVPFESFTIHFAFIPWGFLSLLYFLRQPSKKRLLLLLVTQFLGTAQAQIPTLFISYGLVYATILGTWAVPQFSSRFKAVASAALMLIVANSFWLLPYAYTALTKSAEITDSKINRHSTDATFYRNQAYGTLENTIKLGSFYLDYQDWDTDTNQYQSILEPWHKIYQSNTYNSFMTALFSLTLAAVVLSIVSSRNKQKSNNSILVGISLSFLLLLLLLANNTTPFAFINTLLREYIPLFGQIFRTPFTKFILLYVFLWSFLIVYLLNYLLSKIPSRVLQKSLTLLLFLGVSTTSFFFFNPAFSGNFVFDELRIRLPSDYQQLSNYLEDTSAQTRITQLPAHSFWGWITNQTDWGYRGSGFIWQMLSQPTVDRAFDAWSKYNETAFLQLNHSIYTQNQQTFENYFKKFRTSSVLVDESIRYPGINSRVLFTEELQKMLRYFDDTDFKEFGNLTLFSLKQATDLKLIAPSHFPVLNTDYSTDYTLLDQAYQDVGEYIVANNQGISNTISYPFSFLQQERLTQNQDLAAFTISYDPSKQLVVPEKSVFTTAVVFEAGSKNQEGIEIGMHYRLPSISDASYQASSSAITLDPDAVDYDKELVIAFQNQFVTLDPQNLPQEPTIIGTVAADPTESMSVNIYQSTTTELVATDRFQVRNNSFDNVINCDDVRTSQDEIITLNPEEKAVACISRDQEESELIAVSMDVFSLEPLTPGVCISRQSEATCINKVASQVFATSQQPQTLLTFAELKAESDNYVISLGQERLRTDAQVQKINYDQFTKISYQSIKSFELSLPSELNRLYSEMYSLYESRNDITLVFNNSDKIFSVSEPYNLDLLASAQPVNCSPDKEGTVELNVHDASELHLKASNRGILCFDSWYPSLNTQLEYIYTLEGKSEQSNRFTQSIYNDNTGRFDIELIAEPDHFSTSYPLSFSSNQNTQFDRPIRVLTNLQSFGDTTSAEISDMTFNPLPLSWLRQIRLETTDILYTNQMSIENQQKVGTFLYSVSATADENALLLLPQSFDQGWMLLGTDSSHVIGNGWMNGWVIQENIEDKNLVLIFWPQLLSFVGYVFLIVTTSLLVIGSIKINRK